MKKEAYPRQIETLLNIIASRNLEAAIYNEAIHEAEQEIERLNGIVEVREKQIIDLEEIINKQESILTQVQLL